MIPITSVETLGRVLRKHRLQQHLTQTQAGAAFNLSQKTVSNIEAGKPGVRLETLFNMLSTLELEMRLEPRVRPGDEKGPW